MKYKLKDICFYATGKIDVNVLRCTDYISTENMLPNKYKTVFQKNMVC